MKCSNRSSSCCRVALTGAPGGGKTTAADFFRREIGDRVVIVPEAATILFHGGFPRSRESTVSRVAQTTIFQVQRNLEEVQRDLYPGRILLCDRGTVDGAAYWPGAAGGFFASLGTTLEAELGRYEAVIFFETAALGGIAIEGGNPSRIESLKEAVELDAKLRALWMRHPRFILVPRDVSFFKKIGLGLAALEQIINDLCEREATPSLVRPAKTRVKRHPRKAGR
jgi:predicted ATPase